MSAKPNVSCPICGGPNGCAPAQSGNLETPCWCREVVVGPEVLARVPEAQRGEACICARCAVAADHRDIWGRIYLDHWRGDSHPHEFLRDDGLSDVVPSAASYFVAPRGLAEQKALAPLTGRVLDLGCGAGGYARFLEDRGVAVTAVDASPGAVAVCRERGCSDARVGDIDGLPSSLGPFDAIVCMGNTLGIGQRPDSLPRRLALLRGLSAPTGRLLAAITDPLGTADPAHLDYHARNRAAGRPPGLVRTRLRYRGETGEWWELWMPTETELELAAREAGWTVRCRHSEGSRRLYEFMLASE